jgi:hypothetical protein
MSNTLQGTFIQVCIKVVEVSQPFYRRSVDRQPFMAGLWGQPYVLEVKNLAGVDIEVLTSVDGRNTLIDEPADKYVNRGMIINPYASYTFRGWRLSDTESAPFIFTDPIRSVERMATGQNSNAGVIGFAVYTAKQPDWQYTYSTAVSGSEYGAPAAGASFSIPRLSYGADIAVASAGSVADNWSASTKGDMAPVWVRPRKIASDGCPSCVRKARPSRKSQFNIVRTSGLNAT